MRTALSGRRGGQLCWASFFRLLPVGWRLSWNFDEAVCAERAAALSTVSDEVMFWDWMGGTFGGSRGRMLGGGGSGAT